MTIRFKGLLAPTEVPTGDGRMFASGKLTHRPTPLPLLVRFSSGGHDGATVVGKITRIFDGPGGYWGEGEFLDPQHVPEVPKAIYMLQNKVMGPSVDLDRDFTVEAVKHPLRPDKKAGLFKEYNVIGATLVPMPAFHQVHMSVDNSEEKALLASVGVDTSGWGLFDVNGDSWKNWPLAPRDYKYDADDAVKRIAYWSGIGSKTPSVDRYASVFLWRNGNQTGDSLAQDSFRLPLVDIINNEPHLIYHAVYSAAALLSGAHGGLPNIPDEDKQRMIPVINEMYAAMATSFNDPHLVSPFVAGAQNQASILGMDTRLMDVREIQGSGPEVFKNLAFQSELNRMIAAQQAQEEDCGCNGNDEFALEEEKGMEVASLSTGTSVSANTNTNTFTFGGPMTPPISNIVITFVPVSPADAADMAPADVQQSMEEEQQAYGSDGEHVMNDGFCQNCGY